MKATWIAINNNVTQNCLTKSFDEADPWTRQVYNISYGEYKLWQKLVRYYKNQQGGTFASFSKVGKGNNVQRQADSWEVLDVLMTGVDDFRQLLFGSILSLGCLLKNPQVDLRVAIWESFTIAFNKNGYCGTPVTTSYYADFFDLFSTLRLLWNGIHIFFCF